VSATLDRQYRGLRFREAGLIVATTNRYGRPLYLCRSRGLALLTLLGDDDAGDTHGLDRGTFVQPCRLTQHAEIVLA